jgi:hypothetical protein
VIHRLLREGDPTFKEEISTFSSGRGRILNLSNFKDESSPNGIKFEGSTFRYYDTNLILFQKTVAFPISAWDYSAWVRTYALYLEEKLECFRILRYDIEAERVQVSATLCYGRILKCVLIASTNFKGCVAMYWYLRLVYSFMVL